MFEVDAVDEQARSLLQAVEQMTGQLREFRSQRQHKSHLFGSAEHRLFDQTEYYTQQAIDQVATLVEGVRVDAESGGKVRFRTRMMFAWKNSPKSQVALAQLGIAAQSLNRDLATIANKNWKNPPKPTIEVTEYYAPAPIPQPYEPNNIQEFYNPHLEPRQIKPPPPAYEEALFLAEGRRRNEQRRASMDPGHLASSNRSVSSLSFSPETSSQYRPSTDVALELPSDEGFGPLIDRSPTPSSIAHSGELFFDHSSQAAPFRTFTQLSRPTRPFRAHSGPSRSANHEQSREQAYEPAGGGRHRSMRWLEARSGDSSG